MPGCRRAKFSRQIVFVPPILLLPPAWATKQATGRGREIQLTDSKKYTWENQRNTIDSKKCGLGWWDWIHQIKHLILCCSSLRNTLRTFMPLQFLLDPVTNSATHNATYNSLSGSLLPYQCNCTPQCQNSHSGLQWQYECNWNPFAYIHSVRRRWCSLTYMTESTHVPRWMYLRYFIWSWPVDICFKSLTLCHSANSDSLIDSFF